MKESDYVQDHEKWMEKFRRLPFLNSFNEDYLKKIISLTKVQHYSADEVIIREGDTDNVLFILLFGEARVYKNDKEIAKFNTTGTLFGELSVINEETRSATVKAACKVICLAIDFSFLNTMSPLDSNTCYTLIYRILIEIVTDRLRDTSNELSKLKKELADLKSN